MPAIDDVKIDAKDPPTRGSIIGIIYPPPEVRNIVDKTASFVARNGIEFENRIRQNEINNPKFNFLNPVDPYHAYYQHKVKEFKEGRGQEPSAAKTGFALGTAPQKTQQEQLKIIEPIVPKEPPPDFEFIADPPSISAFDLDVVKLTAQFVARNGRGFLTNLMNREQRNYQFDFLRPQHSLFNYFTKLVEQYTKILIPPKSLLGKLRKEADNPNTVLDQVKYRVEWARFQEREKQKEAEEKEKERVAYAQIDWHDFVVVETVDFQQHEMGNLPPPTTPEEVGARMLAQERFEEHGQEPAPTTEMDVGSDGEDDEKTSKTRHRKRGGGADTTVQDMEEDSDSDDDEKQAPPSRQRPAPPPPRPPPPPQDSRQPERRERGQPPLPPAPPPKDIHQPPLPPTPDQVIIKDYNPKSMKPTESETADYVISPLTGEKIPANKIQEHMRIGLLDPKWIETRDRALAEKRDQDGVYAPGAAIESTLKNLAARRTDIFGSGEETQIGKMIGEEHEGRRAEKVVWDGHSASMEKVSQKARENISVEQQIANIHKSKGLVPDEKKDRIGPTPKLGSKTVTPAPPVSKAPAPTSASSVVRAPPAVASVPKLAPPPQPPKPPTLSAIPAMPQPPQVPVMVVPPRAPPMMSVPAPVPVVAVRAPLAPIMRVPAAAIPPVPSRPMPAAPVSSAPPAMTTTTTTKQAAKPSGDEPPAKKAKTEDQLIAEGEFLVKYPEGVVTFNVQVPNISDKPEWKCSGQAIPLTLPLTDTVSVIKAKLNEIINMPVGKQKLQYEGMFIKDSNSLAFYNLTSNSTIQLQLKERGGRKK